MKENTNFLIDSPPQDSSWYWKVLHKLTIKMQSWYNQDHYCLTSSGKYSVSVGYLALLGIT